MSVLIRGMGMPKDYKYVDVRIFRDGTATTASAEEPFYKKMDVIELPTPHGDLIDRRELNKQIDKMECYSYDPFVTYMSECINDAKAIIEAEGT